MENKQLSTEKHRETATDKIGYQKNIGKRNRNGKSRATKMVRLFIIIQLFLPC